MIKKILTDLIEKYNMNTNKSCISYLIMALLGIYFIGFLIGYLIGLVMLIIEIPSSIKSFLIIWIIYGLLIHIINKNNKGEL